MFFYGTLCHSPILERVLGTRIDQSRIQEARLHHFARKCVNGDDYPALVPQKDANVMGVYVRGNFTIRERLLLDRFEGNEYELVPVTIEVSGESIETFTYLWRGSTDRLSATEWDYDAFLRDKVHRWVGTGSEKEYEDVDRDRPTGN